ncbi:transmembrane protein 68-like [Oxyura jamaicensis]|uniref:transmembrane protein 68-like n=1 Tax=Oxyura jamaicensis TaxID=8884 RepID=UPI0015A67F4F|nr:transmembrane protein 68-like [Oxyura jamaicensis]XP_035173279.1 transmembrane protein 68-like [Oxyura jamaicensis]XP_035173280.1 transmembrane protein 68-like [Oxyura jamaicensis]XP_035173281.1 transmembrane protein 68-like [Oxyura jamaicensis]
MIGGNESCTAGPISLSYLTCVAHLLGEWTGVEHLEDYLGYTVYLSWLLLPLAIAFIFPGIFFLTFIYSAVILLHLHKRKRKSSGDNSGNVWDGARKMLTTIWDGHGRIWHGYEIHGDENIPEGPALFVFYHGACPADIIYFISRLLLEKKRFCYVVADHFVSRIPGFKILVEAFEILHGPKEACVNALKKGYLLGISPGGVREALFSDETYVIIWGNRKGFAQVAIDAKVPIIPVFTQNVREGIRTLGRIKILRKLYERIRLPVVPMYGGFPVKLRTFVGEPIPYDPNITAEELTAKTKSALQALIEKHQKIPGNICRALMERFQTRQKED